MANMKRFLFGWMNGIGASLVIPLSIQLGLALRGIIDREDFTVLVWAFCVPAVGAAFAGALLGLRRWFTGAACVVGAMFLATWAFGAYSGKRANVHTNGYGQR